MINPCVFILTNNAHTFFYAGITSNIQEELDNLSKGFSKDDLWPEDCKKLVYCEKYVFERDALARFEMIKTLTDTKKRKIIEMMNPKWLDLPKYWPLSV